MAVIAPVFLVEDAAQVRERLERIVASTGKLAVVGTAETADDAVTGIMHAKPDLVILDLQLARGTGWEVLHRIGGLEPRPSCIVFSNHSDPEYRRRAREAGAAEFFDKSTEFEAFITAIENWAAPEAA